MPEQQGQTPMLKFVIRRAIQAIPVLFGITVVVYGILLAAHGGPEAKFANNPRITQEQYDTMFSHRAAIFDNTNIPTDHAFLK